MNLPDASEERFFDAIYHGDCGKVEKMLSQGISPDVTNRGSETALLYAALQGQDACVEAILLHGAAYDKLPMVAAAVPNNPAVMRRFLAMGGNPDAPDQWGQTPLMEAANWGNIETVRMLLEHGADAHKRAQNGATAIDAARQFGHVEVTALLAQV